MPMVADHNAVVMELKPDLLAVSDPTPPLWFKNYSFSKRTVRQDRLPVLRRELGEVDWENKVSVGLDQNPNDLFDSFFSAFISEYDKLFPVKTVFYNRRRIGGRPTNAVTDKSWYTPDIRRLKCFVVLLNDGFKSATSPDEQNRLFDTYLRVNKFYRAKVTEAKRAYNVKVIENSPNMCKAAWDVIRTCRPSKPKVNSPASPDVFNNFFIDAVEDIAAKLPLIDQDPLDLALGIEHRPVLNRWKEVYPAELIRIVKNFKPSSSPDVYGVSCIVLKAVIDVIAIPLCTVINKCLRHGVFPDALKLARTVPIHKKGSAEDLANYRPISVLPVLSKVIETVLKFQLTSYLESHELLNDNQHGFRKGRSTTTALLSLASEITDAFEAGDTLALTLCDLSKAFDCVPHSILLEKLKFYGIEGVAHQTFVNYLRGRKQVVSIAGAVSGSREVLHGVPQGSVLGPLLFLILINDLKLDGRTLLFADDTTLVARGKILEHVLEEADDLLSAAQNWFTANKLQLNSDKTQQVLCTLKRGVPENYVQTVKLLGFWLDSRLSWSDHVTQVCTKLSRVIFLLKKLKFVVTECYLLTVYYALFHSHITYGILLWGHSTACVRILLLQKKALRIITSAGFLDHCRPIFQRLGILTVYSQFVLNSLLYIRENVASYGKRQDVHTYRTRRAGDINIPPCRLTVTQKCFPVIAMKFFNSLPADIRQLDLVNFKTTIHKTLVNRPIYSLCELDAKPLF